MAGNNAKSLNLNEFYSEESEKGVTNEDPPSPVLSSGKINRRIIISRKLKQQRSRVKLENQLENELNFSLSQWDDSPETRLKAVEELKSERRKYHDLLCNVTSTCEVDHIDIHKQNCNRDLQIRQNHIIFETGKKIFNCSTIQNQESVNLKTASGKDIIVPENAVNEYKYIFKDIFNDQILDSTVLKYPVQTKLPRISKIPVLNRNIKQKANVKTKTTNTNEHFQVHESILPAKETKEAYFNNSFDFSQEKVQSCKASSIDFAITESFIEAARNIMEEKEQPNECSNFQYENSESMSKLYSNQKFEDSSSSKNSLESPRNSFVINRVSEISIKSSGMYTNSTQSIPSLNFKGIDNKILVMETNECGDLSVMDIVNDDWSDTIYITKNGDMRNMSYEPLTKNFITNKINEKHIFNNIADKNNVLKIENNNIVKNLIDTITEQNVAKNNINNENRDIEVQNNVLFEDNNVENTEKSETINEKIVNNQVILPQTEDKISDPKNSVSNSKSVIHVDIPRSIFDCKKKPLYSKNLIELHRNRNFLGNSEDSGSNIEYKFSEHNIQARKKNVKPHKKMLTEDIYGFDKNTQELTKHKAMILLNNIEKLEREINDRELKNKEEKKSRDKKSKKYKSENGDLKEKDNQICSKETKVKPDKKKKEKGKHGKLVLAEQPKPNSAFEEIATNEEINRTVTYDHISIISQQSCKKFKGHKRRKSITTDKEVVCQNNNSNQVIQISPHQKKFKIEIDCNNKFHINICCNGLQNISDNHKTSDKEIIKNIEDIELPCKAIEDSSIKSMFKSASGKDIALNKKSINDAEKKYEDTNCVTDKTEDQNNLVRYNLRGKNDSKINKADCEKSEIDSYILNEPGKDKFIKKFLNKAHKLYHDITKSDLLSIIDQTSETPKETKCISKLNNKDLESSVYDEGSLSFDKEAKIELKSKQKEDMNSNDFTFSNFCGFRSASGKNLKLSEKAVKRAQALYNETEEKPNDTIKKGDFRSKADDSSAVTPEPVKHRTRILYTDIDNSDTFSKINVPPGYKLVSGKLKKVEAKNEDVNMLLNEDKTRQNEDDIQEKYTNNAFSSGFQSASGKGIKISNKMMEKAKHIFDESSFPAGDASDMTSLACEFKISSCAKVSESEPPTLDKKEKHEVCDNEKLCMGDFKENMTDRTSRCATQYITSLGSNASKKAFELLEDVVETVDCALEKIQRSKVHALTNPRKRLGISKCKQINISREKIDKAKRLFSNENFSESIRDLSTLGTPLRNSQIGSNSTPLRNNMPSMRDLEFSKTLIESEITPIKNMCYASNNNRITNQENSALTMRKRTPGTIDDWHRTVLEQINSVKETLKMLEEKNQSLEKQMSFVHYSNKEHRRQRPGVLYNNKRTNDKKVSLATLEIGNPDYNVENIILNIIPENANLIHFNAACFNNESPTKDGAIVIPNSQNLIGLSEIEMAFRTMVGVEPDLIPKLWIENHYRLIVWKLASYERVFSQKLKDCLSIENIIQQLKYRYDREIDRAQRPAIRRILEKDDVSQKRMILCVSNIIEVPNSRIELELTDGWYCIRTIIDDPLIYQVQKKKIKIGTKLVIYGAELLNCDGCHPLEVTDLVRLKISYNCTRRALWHTKLGYQKCPEPFKIPLQSVHPDGGMIGCIQVQILRVYPIRYMEQIDSKKVWRNSKAEQKYSNYFENERLEKIEKIHYSVQEKIERDLCLDIKNKLAEGSKLNKTEISKLTCPKILFSLLESSNDPENLIETFTPSQRVDILAYRQQMSLQREQEISRRISEEIDKLKLTKRKVVPILKLLVLDDYFKTDKPRQFCIWNPKEDDISLLKEGISLTVYNIVPRSNGDLFSNSRTFFKINKTQTNTSHTKFKRNLFPISLALDPYYQPAFNEFDTIGLVVQVNINTNDQNLWITDATGKMLFIKIKDGPEICSLLDGIGKGHIISLLNLIYCKPQKDFGQALANQFTVISNFSQQNYLREQLHLFKMKLPEDLSKLLNDCQANIENYKSKTDLQHNYFISFLPNSSKSLSNTLDIFDDSTFMQSRLTATDVAMSLIDTDKLT